MPRGEWLYGPGPITRPIGYVELPSLVLDIDVVRDILAALTRGRPQLIAQSRAADPTNPSTDEELVPFPSVTIDTANGSHSITDWDEIRELSNSQRRNMVAQGVGITVDFRPNNIPYVYGADNPLRNEIVDIMMREARRRRPQWKRQLRWLPILGALIVVTLWAWYLLTAEPPPASMALSGAFTVAIAIAAIVTARHVNATFATTYPGHRFTEVTRAEVRDKEASERARARWAARFIPVGIVVGIIGSVATALILRII